MKSRCPLNRDKPPAASSNFAFGFASFDIAWAGNKDTVDEEAEWALAAFREETRGKMVLDCGASKSLGSVVALEDYCDLNNMR
eukprot:7621206-Prorocentrum_lima.AAC.1